MKIQIEFNEQELRELLVDYINQKLLLNKVVNIIAIDVIWTKDENIDALVVFTETGKKDEKTI